MSSRQCCLLHVKETINRYPQDADQLSSKQKSQSEQILARIKSNPDQYIYHEFNQEVQGKNGHCQIAVVGMAIGPFTPIPGNPNEVVCESMMGFYRFYVEGRIVTVPVKLSARRNSATRPAVFYSGVDQAESLSGPDELGIVSAEGPFVVPKYEVVLYSISPIPCGQAYQFSYADMGN